MTLAYWMILVAAVLPILTAGLAKFGGGGYDNARPREWLEAQTGWRKRAEWAQRNHYEAFAPFSAGVIVAELTLVQQPHIDELAALFVALRVGYTLAYVLDKSAFRSILWLCGFACTVALFCLGA